MIVENSSLNKMDGTSLESAIRNEAESAIRAMALKEAEETKGLKEAYAADMEDFRKRMEARTDDRIRQESAKMENRAGLELKKLKLKTFEIFINRTVGEVVGGIRDNPRYKSFLLDAIRDAIARIPTGAEVKIRSGDLIFEREILEAVGKADGKDVPIIVDNTIKWGGCIIIDVPGGRVFDSTIERLYYRKSPVIRREVAKLLGNPPGKARQ